MIIALVGSYPTNKLIMRSLILRHEFQGKCIPT